MPRRTAALIVLVLFASCQGEPERFRPVGADGSLGRGTEAPAGAAPDILLVTIDTLRADFTSPYGHPSDPTPVLGRIAAQGARFEQHYSVMSHTVPAHTSLFTGLHPRVHGTRRNVHKISGELPLLAETLRNAGYRTSAVVAVTFLGTKHGFDRGFESFNEKSANSRVFGKRGNHDRDAMDVVDHAIAELGAGDGRPRFLWVHTYDPHHPSEAPPEFTLSAAEARARYAQRVSGSEIYAQQRLIDRHAGYEADVRFTDHELGRLLEVWDSHPRGRDGLVVVTADHGEGLGEHELLGHGFWNYEEQLLIPLILRMPGSLAPGTVARGRTSQADVAATIVDLAGVESKLGGASLLPLLRGEEAPGERAIRSERRLFTEPDWARRGDLQRLLEQLDGQPGTGRGEQLALIQGDYKYIWTERAPDELFHLVRDPDETRVLIDIEPERANKMRRLIEAYRDETAASAAAIEASTPPIDAATRQALKALGY